MRFHRLPMVLTVAFLATACSDFATAPDRAPSEVRVTPDTIVLTQGESASLAVEVLDGDGEPYAAIPSWSPPFWTSDSPDVLEVDGAGVARALAVGEGRAFVEVAGMSTEAVVRANPSGLQLSVPFVHVTQSVQRRSGGVPLIAGRPGLLRVYVRGSGLNFFRPTVRATFHNGGEVVHTGELTLEGEGLPTVVAEGNLAWSYDQEIPASVFQPGLSLVVEVDPEGIVPATDGSVLRVPETGTMDLGVRTVRPFRLRMVPVDQAVNGRTSRFTQSHAEEMAELTEDLFPFAEFDLDVRAPYITNEELDTDEGWFNLIQDIRALRNADGSDRYYYGGFDRPPGTNIGGLGYVGFPVAIGMDDRPDVIAHEIGHTLSLPHAPCGGPAGPDADYPYTNGLIGQYGFGGSVRYGGGSVSYVRSDRQLHSPSRDYDLMSYCDPIWVSDYNYERVIAYRDTSEYDAAFEEPAAGEPMSADRQVLLLRGGVLGGELRLAPAVEWTGTVAMPVRDGRYTLEGLDDRGGVLFSLSLEPTELEDGGAQFLVGLPIELARTDELVRLRLRGPEGAVERVRSRVQGADIPEVRLDRVQGRAGAAAVAAVEWDAGEYPLAVVRDRQSGMIRAMSRTGRVTLPDGDATRFEVVLSDGVGSRPARLVQR